MCRYPPGMGGRSVVENGFQMSSCPVSKAFHRSQLPRSFITIIDPRHLFADVDRTLNILFAEGEEGTWLMIAVDSRCDIGL